MDAFYCGGGAAISTVRCVSWSVENTRSCRKEAIDASRKAKKPAMLSEGNLREARLYGLAKIAEARGKGAFLATKNLNIDHVALGIRM